MNQQKEDYTDFKAELGPSKQHKSKIQAGLYVVATPIGNLRDITLRALDVLEAADLVLCEDTRITKRLLQAYNLNKPLLAYHDHNADKMRPKIMEALEAGQIVAQASDAGTPLVSDPGYKLVRDCIEEGHKVYPIPGASAPLTALAAAGLPSDRFLFIGFLPTKKKAKTEFLAQESKSGATLICFESPKRLTSTLSDIAEIWPDRQIVVARELTKMFEEFKRGTAQEVSNYYIENGNPKGEIVLLLEPAKQTEASEADIDIMLQEALKSNSVRDAATIVAEATSLPRKQIYKRALDLNG
ncbi:16S rRNA (cytidine(1402)-2'-O)-methyltransferase [Curvivirga aplysinae]|uniref:16S rRNA (cytidine(1402)-2'-O)-methyltransferase n=1 Tax=Curvivirga aplysinae TaxID=2529852 RepID=UPI0012BCBD42|nr:16S rRNA (cytidine(1402)-2'-O)-methyltransferase [Curvivirga aplysinae]MTI09883.1 16S rRNA (cytidine(1402)-2'-O)-methyltransferase [Curvivirga aplysinae]